MAHIVEVYRHLHHVQGRDFPLINAVTTGVAKLWRGYLAPCGEVTKAVARLLSLLWRGYQICGAITCGEVTLWRGQVTFQYFVGISNILVLVARFLPYFI